MKNRAIITHTFLVQFFVLSQVVLSQDWPQWRGMNRDGVISISELPETWPETLRLAWRIDIGEGHSSPVMAQKKIFVLSRLEELEAISCINLENGKIVWRQTYSAPYEMNSAAYKHGKGPKSTPAVFAGGLVTLGNSGVLSCYNTETGDLSWRIDSSKEFKVSSPLYGTAMSPLIADGLCVAHLGGHDDGALIAVDLQTGKTKWKSTKVSGWKFWKGEGPGYASPILATFEGTRQIVTFSQENIIGVDFSTGELLWKIPFTTPWTQNLITPVLCSDGLILAGLDNGVMKVKVVKNKESLSTEQRWKNTDISLYMSSPVIFDDSIVAFSKNRKGQYVLLDANTGEVLWQSRGREGDNAALIRAGDTLISLQTDGKLLVARCDGKALIPLKEYSVADSPTWAHPLIFAKRLLIKEQQALALWNLD